jgi:excisionase family DNA binding protein
MAKEPLFVRIPTAEARKLDEASRRLETPKSRLVAELVARHLEQPHGIDALRGAPVGRAEFVPLGELEVLTLEQLATLLSLEPDVARELAERGEVPGRKLGDEWRFSRAAVLEWLGGD